MPPPRAADLVLVTSLAVPPVELSGELRAMALAGEAVPLPRGLSLSVASPEAAAVLDAPFETVPAGAIAARLTEKPGTLAVVTLDQLDPRMRAIRIDGEHPAARDAVSFVAVGDMSMSRFVNTQIRRRGDWVYPFRRVAGRLRSYDVAVGNLESSVSSRFDVPASGTSFVSDPRALRGLSLAGVDAVSLANNHATNFGLRAFRDSLRELPKAGIDHFGGGRDAEEAHRALDVDVRGERLAFLGYNAIIGSIEAGENSPGIAFVHGAPFSRLDRSELAVAVADVEREAAAGKFVIVFMHWGAEYTHTPNGDQVRTARALVRAGADLVIGAHPHWVQGLEFYRGTLIAYSLGNFVFDQTFERETKQGIALSGLIRRGRLVSFELLPFRIAGGAQPRFVDPAGKEGAQILGDVRKASRSADARAAVFG